MLILHNKINVAECNSEVAHSTLTCPVLTTHHTDTHKHTQLNTNAAEISDQQVYQRNITSHAGLYFYSSNGLINY